MMQAIVTKATEEFKKRDRRFNPDSHLRIHFNELYGNKTWIYGFGVLKETSKTTE